MATQKDPWAVVSTAPAQQDDQWAVKSVESAPATQPTPEGWQDRADKSISEFARPRTPEEIKAQTKGALIHSDTGNQIEQSFQNVGRRGLGDLASMAVHPVQAVKGIYETGKEVVTHPPPVFTGNPFTSEGRAKNDAAMKAWRAENNGPLSDQIHAFQEAYKKDPRAAVEGLGGDLLAMYLSGKLLDAAGKPIKVMGGKGMDALRTTREGMRKGAQSMVGAGERAVKTEVGKTAESAGTKAKATEEANRAELSRHAADVKKADQENVNAHVKYVAAKAETAKANALAQKAVEEHNRAQLRTHQENLDDAARKNLNAHIDYLKKVADTAKENAAKLKEVEEKNLAESKRYEAELTEAQRHNTNAHVKYHAEKAEADQANAAARAIPDSRAGLESHIADTTKDADVRIEKARHDALEEGNRKYSGVNEALGHIEANPETVVDAVEDAAGKIRGSNTKVPILEDISKRFIRGERSGAAEAMTYSDLQGYYSELGREISRGTLPGDVYKALDTLHESIGEEMQRIADNEGKGDELKAAREYWRRMKQTFGDTSDAVGDRAGKELGGQSPEYAKGQVSEYRQRLLGSFDPEIPKLLQDVAAKREQLSKLPNEGKRPTAKVPEYPEEKTVNPPQMTKPPESKAAPEYPGETTVEQPTLKPRAEEKPNPEYPERKEVTPPRTNPIETPTVSTRAIREKLLDRWTSGESQLSKFQVRSLIGGGLGAIVGGLFEGKVGAGVGGMVGSAFGPAAIAKFVEMPAVREWLTRPPAGELETLKNLPHADRIQLTDGLKKVAAKAKAEGVEVSPVLLKAIGATSALPKTQQLQDTRDAQRQTIQQ